MASTGNTPDTVDDVASTSLVPRPFVEIDPTGDMFIEVGTPFSWLFRVSKERLTSVSPAFKTMLGPDFAEGKRVHTANAPLKLPEDNSAGMEELFNIAHFHDQPSPSSRAMNLSQLLVACDKYGCIHVFRFQLNAVLERWATEFFDYCAL